MSDNKPQLKGTPLHVRLPISTKSMLEEMAQAEEKSLTNFLRELIEAKHKRFAK